MTSKKSSWLTFVSVIFLFTGSSVIIRGQKIPGTLQLAEKVYLHVDRVNYTSGDDIWFRAYVIDPSTNKLSANTNNLHVELIAPDSKILQGRILKISGGLGNGDFQLPDSVPSGIYRIRAYTNHMRNYGNDLFFQKEITIINPYDNASALDRPEKKIENNLSISFFPEGGSLIDNVSSTIAFKAVDALGKGCDVSVELYSSAGEQITVFKSKHLGMGLFDLKPFPGYSYYTIVKGKDGTKIKVPLPASFPSGLAISTLVTPDNNLLLTVCTNEITLSSLKSRFFTVNLSSRNLVNKRMGIRVDTVANNYLIPLSDLPDGIIKVTLSEFEGLPLAERLFFLQRNTDVSLKVTTDKKEYKSREKVNVALTLSGNPSFSGTGDFSFSAAESQFTDNSSPYAESIASWFLLESDVKGTIEEPSYYFDPANKNRLQDLDLLLMTQGWRDFKWKYDTLTSFKHEIGFNISGNVKRIINNKPLDGVRINLGLFSWNANLFLDTKTDEKGLFRFEELDIQGKTEAFISSTDKFERMAGRIFIDSIRYEPPETEILKMDFVELKIEVKEIPAYRQEAMIRSDQRKKYKLSDTIKIGEVTITATKVETPQEIKIRESRKFYSAPDKELVVTLAQENYGGDVFSYISGRIAGIRIVRSSNPCSIYYPDDVEVIIREQHFKETVSCTKDGKTVEYEIKRGALILLDGYEIDANNLGSLLSMPMYLVDRVDILTASPLYGMRGANGVINIITKQYIRRNPVELTANMVYTVLNGFNVPRIFYSPRYDNKSQEAIAPDLRSTIFWKPDIRIEKGREVKFDFYNADETGTIKVIAEGVTREGIPLTGKVEYSVK